ncbi:unnamed protein product [Ectocarpus sp. 12 AP-2014]
MNDKCVARLRLLYYYRFTFLEDAGRGRGEDGVSWNVTIGDLLYHVHRRDRTRRAQEHAPCVPPRLDCVVILCCALRLFGGTRYSYSLFSRINTGYLLHNPIDLSCLLGGLRALPAVCPNLPSLPMKVVDRPPCGVPVTHGRNLDIGIPVKVGSGVVPANPQSGNPCGCCVCSGCYTSAVLFALLGTELDWDGAHIPQILPLCQNHRFFYFLLCFYLGEQRDSLDGVQTKKIRRLKLVKSCFRTKN